MFKPMLASPADLEKLRFPLLASPKLDGVRAVVRDGVVYSRSNKPIPNPVVQKLFGACEGFDGELIAGDPYAGDVYRRTVSAVMSHVPKQDHIRFFAFDSIVQQFISYRSRRTRLEIAMEAGFDHVVLHEQCTIASLDDLLKYEEACLGVGYEGLILRDPNSYYKRGRSTTREQIMLKLKRFTDAEALVIGFQERLHNGNPATTNELGRTARSSHQENKFGRGDLGALLCVTPDDIEFAIGTGFDDAERGAIWDNQEHYLHRIVKYKFFALGGKEAPRHPVFLGWRHPFDM